MKRIITLLLALLIVFSFAACDSGDSDDYISYKDSNRKQNKDMEKDDDPSDTKVSKSEATPVPFQKQTVIDDENILVQITELEVTDSGYSIRIYAENYAEEALSVCLDHVIVNGITYDTSFSTKIVAGKKCNENLTLSRSKLSEYIDRFTKITLPIYVKDDSYDHVAEESISLYPYGEGLARVYRRQALPTDIVVLDTADYSVIVSDYKEQDSGFYVTLYVENHSPEAIDVDMDDSSINDFMVSNYFYGKVIPSEACAFIELSWSASTLQGKNIEEVKTVEFILYAYKAGEWRNKLFNETVKISV